MADKWNLNKTNNINQMLRVRKDLNINQVIKRFPNLVIVKHNFHVADDIMFPDPSCLSFFTAFENNHLEMLEKENSIKLLAVDICEGCMKFFVYCKESDKTVYDCISFLKTNNLYKCDFEVILNDRAESLNNMIFE